MNVADRFKDFNKPHCWQYEVKLQTAEEDKGLNLTNLTVEDFDFEFVDKTDKQKCEEVKQFIEKYEWLGKIHIWSTHRFIARHKETGLPGAVVVMATPNAFSNILGKENRKLEKLISRGASTSWAPKNLGSWIITQSIDWMVKNTEFRVFTAYSDPEAKELGTIYQACNFFYLGQDSGTVVQYLDPKRPERGWFGSRAFYYRSEYVKAAKRLGIPWKTKEYYRPGTSKIDWNKVPDDIEKRIREEVERYKKTCKSRKTPKKHKYAFVKGRGKRETKRLKKLFFELNPGIMDYPKERGK